MLHATHMGQRMVQVAPITMVKTDYKLQVLHQIAANSTYICYGIKQNIRILNKNTANRALFKGHSALVTDLQFFSSTSNLLASCDQAGDVHVRKIIEEEPSLTQSSASQAVAIQVSYTLYTVLSPA